MKNKNILNIDKYGLIYGMSINAGSLNKEEAQYLFSCLLETFSLMLGFFSKYNSVEKKNIIAIKRDIIKTHYLKLQNLYPTSSTDWDKFRKKKRIIDASFNLSFDLQDIVHLSELIIKHSFPSDHSFLKKECLLSVLQIDPGCWKKIYLASQEDMDLNMGLIMILENIKEDELREKIIAEEKKLVTEYLVETLKRGDVELFLRALSFPWLASFSFLLVRNDLLPLWSKDLEPTRIFSIISVDIKTFCIYWSRLNNEEKHHFLGRVLNTYKEDGRTDNYEDYKRAIAFFEKNFSAKDKEQLAEYTYIKYASLWNYNRHLWWVPRSKRLNYLKEHTPMDNALCYTLFEVSGGLMSYIGTPEEILNKDELQEYVDYLIDRFGKDACYLNEAIQRYEKWKDCN